jgi:hypothetical protein
MSLWAGIDHSSMHMANVNDAGAPLAVDTTDNTLGGSTYPLANRWWAADEERNWSGGAALSHYFRAVRADLNWNYLSSRGITSYNYAGVGAMTFPYTPAEAGNQFPAMTYIVNSLTFSLTVPLCDRASLRLYDYYERGQINDWHYAGFNNTLVYGNRAYADAGPQGYNTNVVGLFVNVKL